MRLLIVDGSNIVMRCAFGGDVNPERSVPIATGIIERATREWEATHLVIALDSAKGGVSWRKDLYADYKGNRTVDTTPWLAAAWAAWSAAGWWVEECQGWEADDVIATVATRAVAARRPGGERLFESVMVLSGDSDVLPLMSHGVELIRPVNGGKFAPVTFQDVERKYGLMPSRLPQMKAMTGESGDNVPGVDGIGPVRARALLEAHLTLEGVIAAGGRGACRYSAKVAAAADTARLALRLVTLATDAPVVPIDPKGCAL